MKILALESSCDETAITLLNTSKGSLFLEKNQIYSQVDIHKKYGGVVPEVAARKHVETIIPLLEENLGKNKLKNIDYITVTSGPGLITSLLLGVTVAKTLSYINNIPLIPINHIEGHIYSNWLSHKKLVKDSNKYFPSLVLIISGGHTELVLMKDHGKYELLGQTLDDAAGEAFDKVAKMMNLGYPGGPIVSKLAEKGNNEKYNFPRPMMKENNFDFSFSGLKTAVLYTLQKKYKITKKDVNDICSSFQQAVVDVLTKKTIKAAEKYNINSIMIVGGVAANIAIKESIKKESSKLQIPLFVPELKYTGDNSAMIAVAAYYNLINKKGKILKGKKMFNLKPNSNWQLTKN